MEKDDFLAEREKIEKLRKKIKLKAPNIHTGTLIDNDILRRTKVRELRRMGYTDAKEIMYILARGIPDGEGNMIKFDCSIPQIEDDMDYLVQEDLSSDDSFLAKRTVLLDQLKDLYRRAHHEFRNTKGPMKNNFLNTTFSILKAIVEMEGVLNIRSDNQNTEEQQLSSTANQLQKLSNNEQQEILSVLRKIAKDDKEQGTIEEADIPDGTS